MQYVFKKELTKQEIAKIREEMKPIILDPELTTEEQVLFVIERIKAFERKYYGLTDREIEYKYTHRDCNALACVIESLIQGVVPGRFHRGQSSQHTAISIYTDDDGNSIPKEERFFYDIKGKQTRAEISQSVIEGIAERVYCGELLAFAREDGLLHETPTTRIIFDKIMESKRLLNEDGMTV